MMSYSSLLKSAQKISTRIINLSLASIIGLSSLVAATPLLFTASAAAAPVSSVTDTTTSLTYPDIQSAIDAATGPDTITLTSDVTISTQINVNKAITIDGAGFHLYATFAKTDNSNNSAIGITHSDVTIENLIEDGTGSTNLHGINAYVAANVTLNNVTVSHNGHAGMVVNGSSVSATNFNASNNAWGSVNVDPGSGVTAPSVFTFNSGNLADTNQIWSDGSYVTVSATVTVNAAGYSMYKTGGTTAGYSWTNRALTNVATITNSGVTTLYGTIIAAVKASQAGDTIKVAPGNYNLIKDDVTVISGQTGWYLPITQNNITLVGIDANGNEITDAANVAANIYSTQETANGSWSTQNLITVFGDNVTIKGLGVMNKISPNKAIEVLGNNFTAIDNTFLPVPVSLFANANNYDGGDDITKYGSGVYLNNNGATAARVATITNNIFKNSGVTFDSFGNNWTVTVSHNLFDGNKIWTSGGTDYYYSAVGSTTWANQPDFTGSTININYNQFINMSDSNAFLKIKASMTGTFNAGYNYWGSATPNFSALTLGDVTHTPWYTSSAMTIPVTSTASLGGSNPTVTLGTVPQSTVNTGTGTVKVDIPSGLNITGPAGWDGTVTLPAVTSTFVLTPDPGNTATSLEAISIGAGDTHLTFDQPVKLTFVGLAGKLVGWSQAGVFHQITATCDSATAPTLAAGADCKIAVGADLVVWTKHFTTFVSYTQSKVQSYTVVAGDTLSAIGVKFGMDWHSIASYNNIVAPYTIYPGQVLKLVTDNTVATAPVTTPVAETTAPAKVLGASISPEIGTAVSTVVSKPTSKNMTYWYYGIAAVVLALVVYYAYQTSSKRSKN